MKAGFKSVCLVLLFFAAFSAGVPSFAQDPGLERVGSSGTIDWVGQKVTASGIGVVRTDVNPGQARAMAERASLVVARRNLLEVIQGVHIDSRTTVENFLVRDDTVVARVNGEIRQSTVERVEYLNDGTVRTTVSLSMGGNLNDILVRMVTAPSPAAGPAGTADVEYRLQTLEERIRILEGQVSGLKRTSLRQEELIFLFRRLLAAWSDHGTNGYPWQPAGLHAAGDIKGLDLRLREQETRLTEISRRLDEMAGRLDTIAALPSRVPPSEKPPEATVPYTGLVIDARGTGFHPCLKPTIYGLKDPVYPGGYVLLEEAVRHGYVRYYREVGQAQQSGRAGRLPLTIKATGTFAGQRGLQIDPEDAKKLTAISAVSGNFLARCQVVIVF